MRREHYAFVTTPAWPAQRADSGKWVMNKIKDIDYDYQSFFEKLS